MIDIHKVRRAIETQLGRYRRWRRRRNRLGARGEREAARYLRRKRFRLIQRQAKNLYGEIDIIAVDQRTVVFVEVKTRSSHDAGHPAEAVTEEKQRRMTRIALAYLRHHQLLDNPARFDVVAVTWPAGVKKPAIEHYVNAFEATEKFQMFS